MKHLGSYQFLNVAQLLNSPKMTKIHICHLKLNVGELVFIEFDWSSDQTIKNQTWALKLNRNIENIFEKSIEIRNNFIPIKYNPEKFND